MFVLFMHLLESNIVTGQNRLTIALQQHGSLAQESACACICILYDSLCVFCV